MRTILTIEKEPIGSILENIYYHHRLPAVGNKVKICLGDKNRTHIGYGEVSAVDERTRSCSITVIELKEEKC